MDQENTAAQKAHRPPRETPVCLRCLRPVDALAHYCPHCGAATGQLTPILPFESIRWETQIWGRMWRQMWSREVPFPGRLLRLFAIVCLAPVLLIGLLFRPWRKTTETEKRRNHHENPD
jgi:hypothetical protein